MSRLIDWENVCLVCLKKGENRSIFERDTDSNVIVDKIIICADIFIEKGTDKPKSICLQCFDNLNVAYKFHRNYVQSDSIIKALLGTNHQEFQIKDLWKTRSSSGAQQKESPQKEILDVEESPNSDKINIKHETIENGLVDDTHDNHNSPCIDLGDSIDTPAKLVQKDLTETCFQSSAIELNDVKANKNNRAYRQLDIHMRRHKRPFSCDRCDKAFVSSWQLRRHMKVHTGEKPYACQYCGRRFTQKGHQKGHERMHTGEGTFVCPTCGKSFAYFHVLSDHRRIHTGVKKFMCEECGEGFDKRLLLERHAARHLSRDKLDTTSEHKQKKVLEKEIFQIEECAKSNEINIKHEIIESDLVDDSHDNDNSPCVDLEDNIDSEAKLALKDRTEACFQGGAVQQNDVKANKNNKVCGICNGAYRQLDIHMRRHNNERPFSCDRCDKAFVTSWQLRRHMKVHTAEKPYECQYCDRRFTQKSHRQIHERKHTGERPFICPTCGKTFSDSNVLAEHRQIHTAVKKFMCEECGEGFDARLLLERHVSRHLSRDKLDKSSEHKQKKVLEKEIFQIEECAISNEINIKHEIIESDLVDDTHDNDNIDSEAKFTLKDRAEACFQGSAIQQNDVKANEGNKIKQHANDEISGQVRSESKASIENSCDKQSRKTVYKKALKICEICNRGFTDQYILAVHMRRHNNERPFSCDCCYKTYVTSDNLRLHMRAHTGEKPYECQYCDRRFTQKGNRNTHERTHTGERPYQCQYCDRRFIRKSHREKHERGHTGEKPFVCPTCGKSFAYSHSLSEHRWIHTGVSKFTCEKCGKGFNKRANRERHVRRCPNPEKLDKSSDHKQKKLLGKEISQIEENDNSHDINIKHEEIS